MTVRTRRLLVLTVAGLAAIAVAVVLTRTRQRQAGPPASPVIAKRNEEPYVYVGGYGDYPPDIEEMRAPGSRPQVIANKGEETWGSEVSGLRCRVGVINSQYYAGGFWFLGEIVLENRGDVPLQIVSGLYYAIRDIDWGLRIYSSDGKEVTPASLPYDLMSAPPERIRLGSSLDFEAEGQPGLIQSAREIQPGATAALRVAYGWRLPPGQYTVEGHYVIAARETLLKKKDGEFWARNFDSELRGWQQEMKMPTAFFRGAVTSKRIAVELKDE